MDVRTEDNCRIGDPKGMTNTEGAPNIIFPIHFMTLKLSPTRQTFMIIKFPYNVFIEMIVRILGSIAIVSGK